MNKEKHGRFVVRVISLGLLWWILSRGESQSWWFGGPVIVLAASWRLGETAGSMRRWRPWHLATFIPYFFWRSLTGSLDVASRAIHGRSQIAPVIRPYVFRLSTGSPARVFCASCFNMMPGTLTASWDRDTLQVHLLVDGPKPMAALQELETRVGLLFGEDLLADTGEPH